MTIHCSWGPSPLLLSIRNRSSIHLIIDPLGKNNHDFMLFCVVQPEHSACGNGHCRVFVFALGKVPVSPSQLTDSEQVMITGAASSYTMHLSLYLMDGKQLSEPWAAWGIPPCCSSCGTCWMEDLLILDHGCLAKRHIHCLTFCHWKQGFDKMCVVP